MSLTTSGRYVHLPTGAGAERLRTDQPLGADVLATLASNGTILCREGALRTLWESPGGEVWADIPGGAEPDVFPWDTVASDGIFTAFCGVFRVRTIGELATWPLVHLAARGRAPSGDQLGVVLSVMPTATYPMGPGTFVWQLTSSTTITDIELSFPLTSPALGAFEVTVPDERGTVREFAAYVGAWCTSDSDAAKALLANVTLYLLDP